MKSQRQVLKEKADIAVSNLVTDGGYLNSIQANTFIRMVQEEPTLVKQVRTVPMNAPTAEINKIGFATRILHAKPSGMNALAAADRSAATTDQVTLTTKPVIAEILIPYDVLEDNIERGGLEDSLMEMITARAALDIEEMLLLGDTLSGDAFLALQDGILKLAQSHVVDFSGTSDNITKLIFKAGLRTMPQKYLRNKAAMRFYTSTAVEIDYADYLADRTTTLGDTRIESNYQGALHPFGVPIDPLALMPDAQYIFTYPKNIILGIQRDIMVETDRDIRAQGIIIVVSMRLAIQFEEEDAVVKAIGLSPEAITTTT